MRLVFVHVSVKRTFQSYLFLMINWSYKYTVALTLSQMYMLMCKGANAPLAQRNPLQI